MVVLGMAWMTTILVMGMRMTLIQQLYLWYRNLWLCRWQTVPELLRFPLGLLLICPPQTESIFLTASDNDKLPCLRSQNPILVKMVSVLVLLIDIVLPLFSCSVDSMGSSLITGMLLVVRRVVVTL